MKSTKGILLIFLSVVLFQWAKAEDLYVRPGGGGAANGLDWNNAWSSFSQVQWGSGAGRVGPGDTLWIAGGTYSSRLQIGASGAAGSPINIKRVRSSDPIPTSAPGWNSSFDSQVVINGSGSLIFFNNGIGSYVTIDGRVKSGIKVNYQNGGRGVEITGTPDFTDIMLRYIEAAGPGPIVQSGDTRGFDLTSQGNLTNLTMSYCEAHHSDTLVQVSRSTNLVIEYCDLHHAGAVNAATYHPNTIYLATVTNGTIRHNIMREIDVEGLFFGDPGNSGVKIYGNLFYQGSSPRNSGRGIEFDNSADTRNVEIYNNTFVDLPLFGVSFNNGKPHPGAVVRNNIFFNTGANFGPAAHDYNYFSGSSQGEPNGIGNGTSPFVNPGAYDYHIVGTIASNKPRDRGANLGTTYNRDRDGNLRGADGAWDIGAYEYSSGGGTTPPSNTAPTITAISNQTTTAGTAVGPINFTVGDAETPASNLLVSGSSSNTSLVPNSNIVFGGSGSNRTVTITPAGTQSGTATITIAVTDGSTSTTRTFTVTVSAPSNAAPTISGLSSQTTTMGTATNAIPFTVGDAETSASSLIVSGSSSNTTLVPNHAIVFGGSGANRTVTVSPAAGQSGSAVITVAVSDGANTTRANFTLTVTGSSGSTNTAPTITAIAAQSTTTGVSVGPIAFTIGDAETNAGSLILSGTSSNTSLVPNGNITFGGSGANRTVSVAPAAGQTGSATITVAVSDGQANASVAFVLTVAGGTSPETPGGLVAAYSFSEGSGNVVADASGNGNSGEIRGATWSNAGKFGSALTFNGSNSFVFVKPSSSLNLTSAMTLQAWVHPTESQSGWRTVVQKEVDSYFLHISSNSAMKPAGGGTFNNRVVFNTSPSQIPVNGWTHLALTYDGAALRLFVNGNQVSSKTQTGAIQVSNTGLRIGGNVPYGEFFKGIIDEVRVYNRALSAAEIKTDMNAPITPATPPPPTTTTWSNRDIGTVGVAGSVSADPAKATITVKGSGVDIWDNADGFQFVYRTLSGDGTVEARVDSLTNTDPWAKAGVMIRSSLEANASNVLLYVKPSNEVRAQARTSAGASTTSVGGPSDANVRYWVRLVRKGNSITAQTSVDGSAWTTVTSYTVTMGQDVYAGLAVTAHNNTVLATGVFSEPFVESGADAPTGPTTGTLSHRDIGSVGVPGSNSEDTGKGTLTLAGSGVDIWDNTDGFRYAYQTLSGDGTIEARINSITNTDPWAKAGIMIRESLDANARNVLIYVRPSNEVRAQVRTATGGTTTSVWGPSGVTGTYKLRLVRKGDSIAAMVSTDGTSWSTVTTYTLPMGANVYAGYAVTAHNNSMLATGVFSELALK